MKNTSQSTLIVSSCTLLMSASCALAQDWPQWRGPNRDGKATEFAAPKSWPKELTQKWKTTVGEGVATPALVGDKLFVFSRQEGGEVTRCLNAADGKEIWTDKYDAMGASGPAQSFSGPRSSPTVTSGKVVTLGVRGVFSCLNATDGKVLWRKDEFGGATPRFFTSSSPIVVDGFCVAQLGGQKNGTIAAYDLATGSEKWKWTGDSPAYASPVLMTVGGQKLIVAETEGKVLALSFSDGKLVWEAPFVAQRMGYNAATPIVDGQTLIYCGSGRGATAAKLEKDGDGIAAKELWRNPDNSVQFNTPVLKNGFLYGLSAGNDVFCLNAQDGKTAWAAPLTPPAPVDAPADSPTEGGRKRGGRGGGGRGGFGSVVDAGSVLFALTPASELVVFKPDPSAYAELARIKVATSPTHAYPVVSGNRIFIKDQDSVMLWTIQ